MMSATNIDIISLDKRVQLHTLKKEEKIFKSKEFIYEKAYFKKFAN